MSDTPVAPHPDLHTPRLRLPLLVPADRALYCGLHADAKVMAMIGTPLGAVESGDRFERVCAHNRRALPGSRCWSIRDYDGAGLGIVALKRDGTRAEFGIMLTPATWRCGLSTEVLAALLPHAFNAMGLQGIDARRPDDGHARVVDGMFRRFGFQRLPTDANGWAQWALERATASSVAVHLHSRKPALCP